MRTVTRLACLLPFVIVASTRAAEIRFRVQEIDRSLGVGYAVRLVDVNADGKLDIVVVDQRRVIWFENPSWKLRTITEGQTKPDNVCIAPYDIDGDGTLDFALGSDWRPGAQTEGTIQWLRRGASLDEPWSLHPLGAEHSVHRVQWSDLDNDGRAELLVVPLVGSGADQKARMEAPIRVLAFSIPKDPAKDRWPMAVLNEELRVAHGFEPTDFDGNGQIDILVASFEGASLLQQTGGRWQRRLIGSGNQATMPNRGSSEIKLGRLAGNRRYVATIEPWHGFQVVVYTPGGDPNAPWNRSVIDDDLQWGHTVWCANLDADPDDELLIGVRDNKSATVLSGLRVYDPKPAATLSFDRQLVDAGGVAVEDLAAADLDGNGSIDIVAVGRQTKNVRIYWNEGPVP